jgi:hypothetical protein
MASRVPLQPFGNRLELGIIRAHGDIDSNI